MSCFVTDQLISLTLLLFTPVFRVVNSSQNVDEALGYLNSFSIGFWALLEASSTFCDWSRAEPQKAFRILDSVGLRQHFVNR